MRLLSRSLVALVLGLPAPAAAQVVARADLVGVWSVSLDVGGQTHKSFLIFHDDSTWAMKNTVNGVENVKERAAGRWLVSNDSLWLGDPAAVDTIYYFGAEYVGGQIVLKAPAQKVKLTGDKLFFDGRPYIRSTEPEP